MRYVLCLKNKGFPASLEPRKVYRAIPDMQAARHGLTRIVDESGDDYLYPKGYFVAIELPEAARRVFGARAR